MHTYDEETAQCTLNSIGYWMSPNEWFRLLHAKLPESSGMATLVKWTLSLNFMHIYHRSFVSSSKLELGYSKVCNMIRDTVYRWPMWDKCTAAFSLSVVVWFMSPHMWFKKNEILRQRCQQQPWMDGWIAGNRSSSSTLCGHPFLLLLTTDRMIGTMPWSWYVGACACVCEI